VDDLQSEKEQIEEMKAWWAEYGRYVIAGVIIAVGLIIGFNTYKNNKLEAQVEASELFETLVGYVADGDLEDAQGIAGQLASNYANTAYAAQSKLAMARLYMDKNRDQDAADVLQELLAMRGNDALQQVGRIRLARILLYQDKPQEVLDLLEGQDNQAFAGLYAEARGDAHAALGQFAEAAEAYQLALADSTRAVNAGLVQMKLLDLPEPEPVADVEVDEAAAAPVEEPADPVVGEEAEEAEETEEAGEAE
jgi:predicted negative regulator of RcsB-dependent stress response